MENNGPEATFKPQIAKYISVNQKKGRTTPQKTNSEMWQ